MKTILEEQEKEFEHWVNELRYEVKEFCPMCGIKPKKFLSAFRLSNLAIAEAVLKIVGERTKERKCRHERANEGQQTQKQPCTCVLGYLGGYNQAIADISDTLTEIRKEISEMK